MILVDRLHLRPSSCRQRRLVGGVLYCALVALGGCSAKSDVPTGDAAENIRKLALGYSQYAATHGGVGPADKKALATFLVERSGLTADESEKLFASPRDGQPYTIKWKQKPMAASPPPIIMYESEGVEGSRIVADGRPSVRELPAEDFAKEVPNP